MLGRCVTRHMAQVVRRRTAGPRLLVSSVLRSRQAWHPTGFLSLVAGPQRLASTAAAPASSSAVINDDMYSVASKVLDEQTASEDNIAAATDVIRTAAAQGRATAQGRVGRWHLFGICGAPKDARTAVALLHAAAVAGDRDAQYWLGVFFTKAEEFTGAAAGAAASEEPAGLPGSADGETDPARRQELARGVMAEIKAMRKIAKANKVRRVQGLPPLPLRGGEHGDAASSDAAADGSSPSPSASLYAREDPARVPLRSHARRAHHWLMAAALQDHADAQVALGNLVMAHAQAQGSPAGRAGAGAGAAGLGDARQAIGWYELAAQVSHHSLPTTMATAAGAGAVGDDADADAGDDDASAAAEPGSDAADAALLLPAAPNVSGAPPHPDALFNLGMVYHDGLPGVVPRDRIRAAQYFRRAADLFDPAALFWLGYCYHHGDAEAGIAPDGRQALRHLELAAGMGHPGAAHYLSRLYRNGEAPQGAQGKQQRKAGGCGSGGCGSGSCSTTASAASRSEPEPAAAAEGSCAASSASDCEAAGCSPEKISDCEGSGKLSSAAGSCGTGGGSCGTSGGGCGSGGCGPKVRTGSGGEGPVGSGPLHLEPDAARAAYFLGLAAEAGHAEAMFEVADAHYRGRLTELPPSLVAASSSSSSTSSTSSTSSAAPVSGSDSGSARNVAAALRFYEEAAAAGHAEAAICAGAIHFKGEPAARIARDPQRALSLYTQAAQAGSAAGWENVAAILATGARGEDGSLVIPPNRETAAFIRARMLTSVPPSAKAAAAAAGGAGAASSQTSMAAAAPTAAASAAPGPASSSGEGDGSGEGEGAIRTSVYRASDADVAVAGTRRGSGDSPEDPIELDMSTGTAARVLESLTRRPQ